MLTFYQNLYFLILPLTYTFVIDKRFIKSLLISLAKRLLVLLPLLMIMLLLSLNVSEIKTIMIQIIITMMTILLIIILNIKKLLLFFYFFFYYSKKCEYWFWSNTLPVWIWHFFHIQSYYFLQCVLPVIIQTLLLFFRQVRILLFSTVSSD